MRLNTLPIESVLHISKYIWDFPTHVVIEYGWIEIVHTYAQNGMDLDEVDYNGDTPLHIASRLGRLDIVKYLVHKKVKWDIQNLSNATPFELAICQRQIPVIIFLAENTDVDVSSVRKSDVFKLISKGELETIKFLIRKGFVLDLNNFGYMFYAINSGSIPMLQYLLDQGMNINITFTTSSYGDGYNAINLASIHGNLDVVRFLVENGIDLNAENPFHTTPLHEAVTYDNFSVVQYLVENGAYVNARKGVYDNTTSLHIASARGKDVTVEYLLEHGADALIEDSNSTRSTPLCEAVSNGHFSTTKILINHMANLNFNLQEKSLLQLAVKSGSIDTLLILLDNSTHLVRKDKDYGEALELAIDRNNIDMVYLLLSYGASVSERNHLGKTPLYVAAGKGNIDIIMLLLKRGADIHITHALFGRTPLHYAVVCQQTEAVKVLVEHLVKINSKDIIDLTEDNGDSALSMATLMNNTNVIRYLIENGADISIKNRCGQTPLHIAATYCNINIVGYLLLQDADVHIKDDNGDTPLHIATMQLTDNPNRKLCTIRLLTGFGSDVNATGNNGSTPLMNAIYSRSDLDLIEHLLDCGADTHAVNHAGQDALHVLLAMHNEFRYDEASVLSIASKLKKCCSSHSNHCKLLHY